MTTQQFKIYRSSAGSGKTFTLTKEYLKLVLFPPDTAFTPDYYRHILAITFTRDAAREMKERILAALLDFQQPEPKNSVLLEKILEETPSDEALDTRRKQVQKRASLIHSTILHSYSDFAVSTIDAFNQRIVRAFGKDLNLPYNFAIQQDTDELVDTAVGQLFQRIGPKGDPQLSRVVQEFSQHQNRESKDWNIDRAVSDFANHLLEEDKQELLEKIWQLDEHRFLEAQKRLSKFVQEVEERVQSRAARALRLIEEVGLTVKDFHYGKTGLHGYFVKHSEATAKEILEDSREKRNIRATTEDGNWGKNAGKIPENLRVNLLELFSEIENIKETHRDDYWAAQHMKSDVFRLAALKWLHEVVERIKREKGQVFFSDFNKNINRIVEKEPVPYLYERIGEKFHHILIDEFQDTSQLQWHNLIPLVANGLGFGKMNMVVGDAKQAIYRWRGGKSELIVNLPEVPTAPQDSPISEHVGTFKVQQNPQVLGTNFRSCENIIHFNNEFFSQLREASASAFPDVKAYYHEIEQEPNRKQGGHVELEFLPFKKEELEAETFRRIQELVKDLQESKGYKLNDIAILVRKNGQAAFLGEAFIDAGVPILSNESLLLDASPSVRFVVNFMKLIQRPHSPVTKFELVRFLEDHLAEAREGKPEITPFEIAERCNQASILRFVEFIYEYFGIKLQIFALQYLTLYEIGEELIRSFSLFENPDEQIYLQKLLDVLLQFSRNESDNTLDFLEFWERKKEKLAVRSPEGGEAIRIMTIHKSKGLEFPVVIMPFADWSLVPRNDQKLWVEWQNEIAPELPLAVLPCSQATAQTGFAKYYHEEQKAAFLDGLNMLYVATTRPTDKLYILAPTPLRRNGMPKEVSKSEDAKSINELFVFFLTKLYTKKSSELKDRYFIYEDFSEKAADKKPHSEVELRELKHFFTGTSRNKIKMRRNNLRYSDSNLSIEDFYSEQKDKRLVPFALERVRYRDDIPRVVQRLTSEGLIAATDQTELRELLERVVQMPALQSLFRPNPEVEVEVGREIMTGSTTPLHPDRLIRKRDGSLIVLKFHHGEASTHAHKGYLRKCGAALQKMGQENVKLWLVDTEAEKLEVV